MMLHPTDTIESFKSNVANQLSLIVPAGRSLPLVDGRSGNLILKIEQIREAQWIRVEGTQDQRFEEIVGESLLHYRGSTRFGFRNRNP